MYANDANYQLQLSTINHQMTDNKQQLSSVNQERKKIESVRGRKNPQPKNERDFQQATNSHQRGMK